MTLAFWNGGTPRVLRSNKRVRLANGDIVLNAAADPANDLYHYVEAGAAPGRFQRSAGVGFANDGWTITATRTVEWIDLDAIRERRRAEVKAEAGQRILSILPDWKQRNLTARAVELTAQGPQTWTAEEQAEWDAGQALWTWVKAVRLATDIFEADIAAETDAATAAGMQPLWPDWPDGHGPEGS